MPNGNCTSIFPKSIKICLHKFGLDVPNFGSLVKQFSREYERYQEKRDQSRRKPTNSATKGKYTMAFMHCIVCGCCAVLVGNISSRICDMSIKSKNINLLLSIAAIRCPKWLRKHCFN